LRRPRVGLLLAALAAGPRAGSGSPVRFRRAPCHLLCGPPRRHLARRLRDGSGRPMNNLELAAHWVRGRETLPRYLILGMTNLCNSKCVTCFYWDHLNVNRHLEMSLDDYSRALADLPSLYSVVLTGGEPT